MNKPLRLSETAADRASDDSIEDHLLEQIVGGRGRGYSTSRRSQISDVAAEAVAAEAEPVHYGKFGGPAEPAAEPEVPKAEAPAAAAEVMAALPTAEPVYDDPTAADDDAEKPEFGLSTSYTAEADNMKTTFSTGIEGVLRADSSGAAIGFGLKAGFVTEINLGSGTSLTNTTETAISAGAQIMYHNGIGAEAAAEISARVAWEVTRQTELGNGVTMDNSAKVEGFMGASAEGEGYIGEKGGKWGFDAKAGADYTAETKGTIDAGQIAATGGASVSSSGSVGGAFSQEATYEHGALTLGLSGDVDAVLAGGGLSGSVSIQFEDKYGTVGSPEEIAAVQSQLQHFDSAADLDRSLSETWHNDLKSDARDMREIVEWAEHRLERHTETLIAFDTAISATIDSLAAREGAIAETKAGLAETEGEIRAAAGDAAAFDQLIADMRAVHSGEINHQSEIVIRNLDAVLKDTAGAADVWPGDDMFRDAMSGMQPPERVDGASQETRDRMYELERHNPELFEKAKVFVVEDAKQDFTEIRLGIDKSLFQGFMQSDKIEEFKTVEKTAVDGYLLQMEMAGNLADGLEARIEATKDLSYSAAVVTADKMVAIADSNVADAAKGLVAAQERLSAAQAEVDNSPRVGIRGSVAVSPEDAQALADAKAAYGTAEQAMGQAMIDQQVLYARATALHPEKSMAATEAWAESLYNDAKAGVQAYEAQFVGTEMNRAEQAEFLAIQGVEKVLERLAGNAEGDGDRLDNKAQEFSEKSEVLKAQLALLTAMELKERGVLGYAEEYFNEATGVLGEGVTEMARAGEVTIDAIGSAATTAGNGVVDAANATADGVVSAANAVGDAAEDTWNAVTSWW